MKKYISILFIFILLSVEAVEAEDNNAQYKEKVFNWYAVDMPTDKLAKGSSKMMAPSFFDSLEQADRDANGHFVIDGAKIEAVDESGDGKADMWKYLYNGRLILIENDNDGDEKADIWRFYDGRSLKRLEVDRNHDGKTDMISFYDKGQKVKMQIDQNLDGKIDRISYYEDGKTYKMELDSDYDGIMDKGFDRTEFMNKRKAMHKKIYNSAEEVSNENR